MILLYDYIYIYIYIYTQFFIVCIVRTLANIYLETCSYIQKMTMDLINTFKITIYNTKHTPKTPNHIPNNQLFQTSTFKAQIINVFESMFSAHFYGPFLAGLIF